MTANDHRQWFRENIAWFESLPHHTLDQEVPACDGWTVTDALNHLSFGLGVGYQIAVASPPDADPATVFAELEIPDNGPHGDEAVETFRNHMGSCADRFDGLDPTTPCWTYAGPGVAAFWFRRAAVETWLHRVDVADALGIELRLNDRRARDGIEETFSFTFPMAIGITGRPSSQLIVESPCLPQPLSMGDGGSSVAIRGTGHDVLLALWGRHRDRVDVDGPPEAAGEWLGLVEVAFARPE